MTISTDLVQVAAAAVASALPVPATLSAGQAVAAAQFSGPSSSIFPLTPGAAIVASIGTAGTASSGDVAVIVDAELVRALATSPLGSLDLAFAVQPALDAAAHATTGAPASPAQQFEVEAALGALLDRPGAQLVPLIDTYGVVTATLIVAFEQGGIDATEFVQNGLPTPAAPDANTLVSTPVAEVPIPRQTAVTDAVRPTAPSNRNGLDLLRDVAMEITVELGRTRMTVRELLSLTPGAVIELDRAAGSPADLLVNGTLIARGEVVVVDEDFGIRITEIISAGSDATGPSSSGLGAA